MKKKILSVGAVLLCIILVSFALLYLFSGEDEVLSEKAEIEVLVTAGNYSETHTFETDSKYLGDALLENGLIKGEQGQYGLFITEVAGILADSSKEEWWCLLINGESAEIGISSIEIIEDEKYELVLKKGFN